MNTMTGSNDEEWFYKITICIEGMSGNVVERICRMILDDNYRIEEIYEILELMEKTIIEMTKIIKKMFSHCGKEYFFNNIRIFMSGSSNNNINGIILKDKNNNTIICNHKGGSAAQSTVIQLFDAFLGVKHEGQTKEYLDEMKDYMPEKHRLFLNTVQKSSDKILKIIESDDNLISKKNCCVDKLITFRKTHIELIKNYIVKFNDKDNVHGVYGSGGTQPLLFCNSVINKCRESQIIKVVPFLNEYYKYIGIILFIFWLLILFI